MKCTLFDQNFEKCTLSSSRFILNRILKNIDFRVSRIKPPYFSKIEAHDVGPGGTMTERLRASGAIATAATHRAQRPETVAKRHTWQVAMHMAANRALHYAGQLRRKGRRVTISLPSVTTARDLQPVRPGETRAQTSHRDMARNNSFKLQQLGTHVKINVDTATTPQRLRREAEEAARIGDLRAQVHIPRRAATAIPLWDELRIWDPAVDARSGVGNDR